MSAHFSLTNFIFVFYPGVQVISTILLALLPLPILAGILSPILHKRYLVNRYLNRILEDDAEMEERMTEDSDNKIEEVMISIGTQRIETLQAKELFPDSENTVMLLAVIALRERKVDLRFKKFVHNGRFLNFCLKLPIIFIPFSKI